MYSGSEVRCPVREALPSLGSVNSTRISDSSWLERFLIQQQEEILKTSFASLSVHHMKEKSQIRFYCILTLAKEWRMGSTMPALISDFLKILI